MRTAIIGATTPITVQDLYVVLHVVKKKNSTAKLTEREFAPKHKKKLCYKCTHSDARFPSYGLLAITENVQRDNLEFQRRKLGV
jgi:hypothetical protein